MAQPTNAQVKLAITYIKKAMDLIQRGSQYETKALAALATAKSILGG